MHVSWWMNINGHMVHLIWCGYHCIKMLLHVSTLQSLFGRFAVLCAIGPPKTSLSDVKTSENGDNSRQLEWLLELKSLSSTWSATLAERFLSLRPCSVESMTWKQSIAVRWHVSIIRDMRSQCHHLQNEGVINLIWFISDMLFPNKFSFLAPYGKLAPRRPSLGKVEAQNLKRKSWPNTAKGPNSSSGTFMNFQQKFRLI